MGTDIHMHVEVKIRGAWEHLHAPSVSRNYALFEKLAGVRGRAENAIAPPRGLPTDATTVTRFDYDRMGVDAHTPSHLTSREIVALEDWLKTQPGGRFGHLDLERDVLHAYFFGNSHGGVARGWDHIAGVEDVRLVFWFDC